MRQKDHSKPQVRGQLGDDTETPNSKENPNHRATTLRSFKPEEQAFGSRTERKEQGASATDKEGVPHSWEGSAGLECHRAGRAA